MREERLTIFHLFTHHALTRGGAFQGVSLAEMQHRRGHNVTCIFHKRVFHSIDKTLKRPFPFRVIHMNMKNPISYIHLAYLVNKEMVNIIHCHRNLALLFGFFSVRVVLRDKKPVLVVNRGTTYMLPNYLTRMVFRSPGLDHIIAVSHAVKDALVNKEGVPANKISVIYGSYDKKRFHPTLNASNFRSEIGIEQGDPLIVSIAAVDRRKGIEYFFKAAKRVREVLPRARFCIVGHTNNDEEYYHYLLQERERLKLTDAVIFIGHREDIPNILAACDVSVCASVEGEGITGALRESLAMKKPVVTTSVSGNTEIVKDKETGWVIPPADEKQLAEAIIEAITNTEEARRRALLGYELVRRICTPEVRYRRVMELYTNLMLRKHHDENLHARNAFINRSWRTKVSDILDHQRD